MSKIKILNKHMMLSVSRPVLMCSKAVVSSRPLHPRPAVQSPSPQVMDKVAYGNTSRKWSHVFDGRALINFLPLVQDT